MYVCPFRVSWLVCSEAEGLWAAGTAVGARVERLAHMSYRFPENCAFLDSCLKDSQTAAASPGQPLRAELAHTWNAFQDLKGSKTAEVQ